MLAQQVSFSSSWKQLTRDKGWIKPLLILGLLSWIPFLGEIVVFGYGFEWARLTAWGVDAAPKQRGVNRSKVFATGCRTFLVMFTMRAALLVLPMSLFHLNPFRTPVPFIPMSENSYNMIPLMRASGVLYLVLLVVLLVLGAFMMAASLRATIYDRFGAGWRIDRILQMISRDVSGFMNAVAVALIGSAIIFLYIAATGIAGGVAAGLFMRMRDILLYSTEKTAIATLLTFGVMPMLLIVVTAVAALYVLSVLGVTMQLISINAMGQWFRRFDVGRWGVSSAPLPADVNGSPDLGSVPAPPVVPPAPESSDAAPHPAPAPETAPEPMPEPAPEPPVEPAAPAPEPSCPVGPPADRDDPVQPDSGNVAAGSEKMRDERDPRATAEADRDSASTEADPNPPSATMRQIPAAPQPTPDDGRTLPDEEPRHV